MGYRRTKTPADIRRFLGWLIQQGLQGKIDPKEASKYAYIANIMLKAIELEGMQDLHEKVTRLEAQQRGNYYGTISDTAESDMEARIVN